MPAIARAGPGQNQGPETQSKSPISVAGTSLLNHLLAAWVSISKKLESGHKPRLFDVGCRPPKWHLFIKIYLFIWKTGSEGVREGKRERERDWEIASICFPRWLQQPALSQATARSLIQVSYVGGRDPNTWAIFCHFPRHINRELDQRWSSRETNQQPYERGP